MRKIPVKEYARLNGTSIYQVIRKIARGELEGVTLEENGVKVNYVVLDEAGKEEPVREPEATPATVAHREPPADLAEEIRRLREEVAALSQLVSRCCRERLE